MIAIRPRGAKAFLLLAHGAGAGMTHPFMQTLAEALAERSIATLRWDMPYMVAGKARPDRAPVAEAAVREAWAATAKEKLPKFAGGKSFGGRMTSRAHHAEALAGLRGLVFFGFPLHPPDKPGIERADHMVKGTPMLFLQGDRDELAELSLLRPVVKRVGGTLHVVEHADHGFEVLVRSGRTPAQVFDELAGTAAKWMIDRVAQ